MSGGGSGETKVGVAEVPPKPQHEYDKASALKALAVSGVLILVVCTRELTGITSERFAEIPTNEIEKATARSQGSATVYDVTLAPSGTNTTTSDDIAKQLVTTVATLVTAVAAFYFGANTVSAAHKEALMQTVTVSRGNGVGACAVRAAGRGAPDP
jgi:hypothetical protein